MSEYRSYSVKYVEDLVAQIERYEKILKHLGWDGEKEKEWQEHLQAQRDKVPF